MKKNNLTKKIRNFLKVCKYIFIEPTVEQAKEVCVILYGEEFVLNHILGSTRIVPDAPECLSSEQIVKFCASPKSYPLINKHLNECEICREKIEDRLLHISNIQEVKDSVIDKIIYNKNNPTVKNDIKHEL